MSIVIYGQIRTRTDTPLIYATDGAARPRPIGHVWHTGFGWISTHGHYGVGHCPQPEQIAGRDIPTVAELRAVWHAVGEMMWRQPVLVLLDSQRAVDLIEVWKTGRLPMPGGYRGSQRRMPRLEVLARTVAEHPRNITARWVRGHSGHLLNEAADALARIGSRWRLDGLDKDVVARRARFVVDGFLADPRCREVA